jgi:hypothetical protein
MIGSTSFRLGTTTAKLVPDKTLKEWPNNAFQPTPLRVERDRADFVWYNQLEGVPDLLVAARLNAGVRPLSTPVPPSAQ